MHYKQIEKLQHLYGYKELQQSINNGSIWHMEGSSGRYAMDCIKQGKCILPTKSYRDYYGNKIPSRYEVNKKSIGSYYWAVDFWSNDYNLEQFDY